MYTFIICLLAGLGAGLGTGFAGMSAAAVISPMLIAFLDIPSYEAIGIALASDVLASAVSAYTYGKNKNLDIKNGTVMMVTVLLFTALGSLLGSYVPGETMESFSVLATLLLGIKFIVFPVLNTYKTPEGSEKSKIIRSVLGGVAVGSVCGFVGAGGGMMMLLVLVSLLRYELKTAVGTSVFIMTFTALTGSISHFVIGGGVPDVKVLILCIIFTLIFARIAARIANVAKPKTLSRLTGLVLTVLSIGILIVNFIEERGI